MRAWRLGRIQSELHRLDLGGIILYDPVNIRYATRLQQHAGVVHPQPDPLLLRSGRGQGCPSSTTRSRCISTGTWRPSARSDRLWASSTWWLPENIEARVRAWAQDIDSVMRAHGAGRRIAADRLDFEGANALQEMGYEIASGTRVTETRQGDQV